MQTFDCIIIIDFLANRKRPVVGIILWKADWNGCDCELTYSTEITIIPYQYNIKILESNAVHSCCIE